MAARINLTLQEDRVIVELPRLGATYVYHPHGSWRERARVNREFRRVFGWSFTSTLRHIWKGQRPRYTLRHLWLSDWQQLGLRAKHSTV